MADIIEFEGVLNLETKEARKQADDLFASISNSLKRVQDRIKGFQPVLAGKTYETPIDYAKHLRSLGFSSRQTTDMMSKELLRQNQWMKTKYANEVKAASVTLTQAAYNDEDILEKKRERATRTRKERVARKTTLSELEEIGAAVDNPEYSDVMTSLLKRGKLLSNRVIKDRGSYTQEQVSGAIKIQNKLDGIEKASRETAKNTNIFSRIQAGGPAASAAIMGLGSVIQRRISGFATTDKPYTEGMASTLGSAATMGAIGAIAGPIGAAVGAAVGATIGASMSYYQKIQSEGVDIYRSAIFGKGSSYNAAKVAEASGLTTAGAWRNFEMSGATYQARAMLGEISDQEFFAYGMLPEYQAAVQSGQSPMAQARALRAGLKRLPAGMQQVMLGKAKIDTSIRDYVMSPGFGKANELEPLIVAQEERDRKNTLGYHLGAMFNVGLRNYYGRRAARNMFRPDEDGMFNTGAGGVVSDAMMSISGYSTKDGRASPNINVQLNVDGTVLDSRRVYSSKTDGDSKTYIYSVGGK